jgi:hypothetical protein
MANRMKGEASFTYDGRTVKLAVNMEALLRAEDETGEGLLSLLSSARLSVFFKSGNTQYGQTVWLLLRVLRQLERP